MTTFALTHSPPDAYKVGWDTVAYAKLVGYQPFRLTGKEHLHFLKLNSALRKAIIDHVDPHTVPRQSIYGRYLLPQMPDVKRKDEEDEISPKRENPRGRSSSPHVRHHDKIPRIVSTTTVLDDGDEDSRDSTDTLLDMRVMSPTTVDRAVPARRR